MKNPITRYYKWLKKENNVSDGDVAVAAAVAAVAAAFVAAAFVAAAFVVAAFVAAAVECKCNVTPKQKKHKHVYKECLECGEKK